MSVDYGVAKCQDSCNDRRFGLCDDPPPSTDPAYIDRADGSKWVAVVVNPSQIEINFTALDHCVEILRANGKKEKQCECMLHYNNTVIFVELKTSPNRRSGWVGKAEEQIRASIETFANSHGDAAQYSSKRAYIANSNFPKIRGNQTNRMEQFMSDTGYVLRIENRITIN
jgi:hypothetical protein